MRYEDIIASKPVLPENDLQSLRDFFEAELRMTARNTQDCLANGILTAALRLGPGTPQPAPDALKQFWERLQTFDRWWADAIKVPVPPWLLFPEDTAKIDELETALKARDRSKLDHELRVLVPSQYIEGHADLEWRVINTQARRSARDEEARRAARLAEFIKELGTPDDDLDNDAEPEDDQLDEKRVFKHGIVTAPSLPAAIQTPHQKLLGPILARYKEDLIARAGFLTAYVTDDNLRAFYKEIAPFGDKPGDKGTPRNAGQVSGSAQTPSAPIQSIEHQPASILETAPALDLRTFLVLTPEEEAIIATLKDPQPHAVRMAIKIAVEFRQAYPEASPTEEQWKKKILQKVAKLRHQPAITGPTFNVFFLDGPWGARFGLKRPRGNRENPEYTDDAVKQFHSRPAPSPNRG